MTLPIENTWPMNVPSSQGEPRVTLHALRTRHTWASGSAFTHSLRFDDPAGVLVALVRLSDAEAEHDRCVEYAVEHLEQANPSAAAAFREVLSHSAQSRLPCAFD
ncbi:hypothetical protein [Enterovirga sp. CN4-39]|uniref:hypothetical protein n=1 Tax=Enterovirga sp. CN4-39 TaxID=3400910 RepID=UPI003C050A63